LARRGWQAALTGCKISKSSRLSQQDDKFADSSSGFWKGLKRRD
jgi:hypothetical protein